MTSAIILLLIYLILCLISYGLLRYSYTIFVQEWTTSSRLFIIMVVVIIPQPLLIVISVFAYLITKNKPTNANW